MTHKGPRQRDRPTELLFWHPFAASGRGGHIVMLQQISRPLWRRLGQRRSGKANAESLCSCQQKWARGPLSSRRLPQSTNWSECAQIPDLNRRKTFAIYCYLIILKETSTIQFPPRPRPSSFCASCSAWARSTAPAAISGRSPVMRRPGVLARSDGHGGAQWREPGGGVTREKVDSCQLLAGFRRF